MHKNWKIHEVLGQFTLYAGTTVDPITGRKPGEPGDDLPTPTTKECVDNLSCKRAYPGSKECCQNSKCIGCGGGSILRRVGHGPVDYGYRWRF